MSFALYHDVSEVIMAIYQLPVKYQDEDLRDAYKNLEERAREDLLHALPEDLRKYYRKFLIEDGVDEEAIVIRTLVKSLQINCRHI